MKNLAIISLLLLLNGCLYKMPDKDVIATVPHTNNPMVTREKNQSVMPGLK